MEIAKSFFLGLGNPISISLIIGSIILLTLAHIRMDIQDKFRPAPSQPSARPVSQPEALGNVKFTRRALMNRTEYRVFATVEGAVARTRRGFRVMAQTSLGEVLRTDAPSTDKDARRAYAVINSKRLDIAIIDRSGLLVLAIEVQGSGHHLSDDTFIRDAVKREALRRAGVEMLEITPDWDNARIEVELARRLTLSAAA